MAHDDDQPDDIPPGERHEPARRVAPWRVRQIELARFHHYVGEAFEALPTTFREKLDNVEIVVEAWPDAETLRKAQVNHPAGLLGFYHGVPKTRRTHQYGLVLPDKISLYFYPIILRCASDEEVREMVRHVLYHEIAHHFGIDDARLHEIGAY